MKNLFKLLLSVLSIFLALAVAQAQTNTETDENTEEGNEKGKSGTPLSERIYFGGNLGFGFGDVTFYDISPLVGYRLTDQFSMGLGGTYRYTNNKIFNVQFDVTGGRIFARYDITPTIYPYLEYERLSFRFGGSEQPREWQEAIFGGAGFFQPMGRRGGVNILALYMLNWTATTRIYSQPWQIRVGFQY